MPTSGGPERPAREREKASLAHSCAVMPCGQPSRRLVLCHDGPLGLAVAHGAVMHTVCALQSLLAAAARATEIGPPIDFVDRSNCGLCACPAGEVVRGVSAVRVRARVWLWEVCFSRCRDSHVQITSVPLRRPRSHRIYGILSDES